MEYAADDINLGYRTVMMFINDENTLVDKLQKLAEVKPEVHPIQMYSKKLAHQGGVEFYMLMKSMPTLVKITMNYDGTFDITTTTELGTVTVKEESSQTLTNFLHIFYINLKHDEDKLLQSALDQHTYRKAAKVMHYRELFGDDIGS